MTTDAAGKSAAQSEFDDFMDRCHEALAQQTKGHSQPFLTLWSHTPDVTVMAAVGGYQTGFEDVSGLLHHVSKSLDWDTWSAENLATGVAGDVAFTVELERMTRTVNGQEEEMTLRATQVYRRIDGDWMVIHRHGDLLTPYEEKW
jgi:ketosteroid isomerase-like protein